MYESLIKVYYKNEEDHENVYKTRFNSESTVKLPLYIKAWKGNRYQLFYVNTPEITKIITDIYELINMNYTIYKEYPKGKDNVSMKNYWTEMLIKEIMATNNIEGIRSTRKELLSLKDQLEQQTKNQKKQPRFRYVFEKYYNLREENIPNLKTYQDLRTIYDEFISDEIDAENQLDGEWFRAEGVDVIDASGSGKSIHKGVMGEDAIINHITQLLDFMNTTNNVPMLIKIAVFQYYFGYIHPFYDGNGRVSRYIMSCYLNEIDRLLSFKISKIIFDNIKNYYSIFKNTSHELNKGDLTPFITQMLSFFKEGVEEINTELNRDRSRLMSFKKFVEQKELNLSMDELQLQILFIVYQSTLYEVSLPIKDLQHNLNRSYRTVRTRLDKLIAMDLVCRSSHSDYKITNSTMNEILEQNK